MQERSKSVDELLRASSEDARAEQEAVLLDIVERSKNSDFGRKHDSSEIESYSSFCERVPLSEFDDYREYIERMKLGDPDLLFPRKASCFVVSTGTTGVPKYIPESDAGALAKNIVSRMRMRAWYRMLPEVFTPESKIFPITNAAVYERTEGGIPAGSASGLTAASGKGKRQPRNAIPPALLTTPELSREDTDYLMMLFALAERNVARIALNNVAHFHLL